MKDFIRITDNLELTPALTHEDMYGAHTQTASLTGTGRIISGVQRSLKHDLGP